MDNKRNDSDSDPACSADPRANSVEILCPECDYNLRALTSNRCPWCGWEIDVDVLVEEAKSDSTTRRMSAGVSAVLIGIATTAGVMALVSRAGRLTLYDAVAVLGVSIAAVGHVGLGALVLSAGRRFPVRRSLSSDLVHVCGWLSMVAAIGGALGVLGHVPIQRVVRGVQVNGVFEFFATASIYSLPGAMLLMLWVVSVRHRALWKRSLGVPPTRSVASISSTAAAFSIDAFGRYGPADVTQTWSDVRRPTSAAIERLIAEAWETQAALAGDSGTILYNGDLVRAIRIEYANGKLHFELGPTCFRDFFGTNLFNAAAITSANARCFADAVGVSALVATSDGYLALGRRNQSVAFHAGCLHTFGGLIEPKDRTDHDGYDFFSAIGRELGEELRVGGDEVASIVLVAVVRDDAIRQPELLFDATVAISRGELLSRFDPAMENQEHASVEFVRDDPDAILPFLRHQTPFAPVAEASLLLHGRHRWGEAWYQQACDVLFMGAWPETRQPF